MNRDELFDTLQDRPLDPVEAKQFDDALMAQLSRTVAVLALDLSGFTRLTKKHGILHFLAIFQRAVELAGLQVPANGGRVVKAAADNVIAVFPDPVQALAATRAIFADAAEHNADRPDDGHIRMSAGIGYGRVLLLDDDAFGDDVNVAFKLSEDIAEPSEILLSEMAVAYLSGAGVNGSELDGPRSRVISGVDLVHYATA